MSVTFLRGPTSIGCRGRVWPGLGRAVHTAGTQEMLVAYVVGPIWRQCFWNAQDLGWDEDQLAPLIFQWIFTEHRPHACHTLFWKLGIQE